MKTTLDGVVFLLPHVSGHAKNGVSPQADFPRTERRARKRHAPFGRVGRAAGGGRQGGRTARWQGSGRQATRQRAARRRAARRRAARRQSSRTAKWQGGKVAGRQSGRAARRQSGRTAKWQDGKVAGRQDGGRQGGKVAGRQSGRAAKWQGGKVAGRQGGKVAGRQSGRTAKWQGGKVAGRQGGRTAVGRAAEKEGIAIFFEKKLKTILSENHMSPHPGGKAASSQRTDPGRRPHKQKTGETHNVPPVLAPGFQPPGAAGQRKSARRSSPASAKGQRTGSQYAVRTPGRVQYYPHGRR